MTMQPGPAGAVGFINKKYKDWFDENGASVTCLLNNLHSLYIAYADKGSQTKENHYKKAKHLAQAELREIKNYWWIRRTWELQIVADINDAKRFSSELKAVCGPHSTETSPQILVTR